MQDRMTATARKAVITPPGPACLKLGHSGHLARPGFTCADVPYHHFCDIDVMHPLKAFDAGARSRTVSALLQALAHAKEAGIDPDKVMGLVIWEE